MMQIGSLLLLFLVIFLGMITKKNVGIIGFLAAYVYGTFVTGMKAKEIYARGLSHNGIFPDHGFHLFVRHRQPQWYVHCPGTERIISSRDNNKLIPWMFFGAAAILAGVGGLHADPGGDHAPLPIIPVLPGIWM